jgi:hypothetical protein
LQLNAGTAVPDVEELLMAFLSLRRLAGRCVAGEVKPGDSYRRRQGNHVAETATVLAIRPDLVGIPHVLFKLAFECSDSNSFEDGSRILALNAFLDVYRERVSIGAADVSLASAAQGN